MKNAIITALLAITITVFGVTCYRATPQEVEPAREVTARLGVVTEVDRESDIVTFETVDGNIWSFYGCEDWEADDEILATYSTTGNPEEDIILTTTYYRSDLMITEEAF